MALVLAIDYQFEVVGLILVDGIDRSAFRQFLCVKRVASLPATESVLVLP